MEIKEHRFGSEAKLVETVMEQALKIHMLESELEKLKFLYQAKKAKLKKTKEELEKSKRLIQLKIEKLQNLTSIPDLMWSNIEIIGDSNKTC